MFKEKINMFPVQLVLMVLVTFVQSEELIRSDSKTNTSSINGIYYSDLTVLIFKLHNVTLNASIFVDKNVSAICSFSILQSTLTSLDDHTFMDFVNLKEVTMNYNKGLLKIPADMFINNTKIENITLTLNNFTSLEEGTFTNLLSLKRLDLSFNQIAELPPTVFQSVVSLETLIIQENRLKELRAGLFDNLSRLRYVDLSCNEIKHISAHLFKFNYGLETVNLQGNRIKHLSHSLLHLNLKTLNLHSNPLDKQNTTVREVLESLHAKGVKTGVHAEREKHKCEGHQGCSTSLNYMMCFLIIVVILLLISNGYLIYAVRILRTTDSTERIYTMHSVRERVELEEEAWLETLETETNSDTQPVLNGST